MTVVPHIDLTPARGGDPEARRGIARRIDQANRSSGFLVLAGHGVPQSLLTEMYDVTKAFFNLPDVDKNRLRSADPAVSRGYMPPKSRALAHTHGKRTPADLVEFFSVGAPHVPAGDPYFHPDNAGVNFRPNLWPAEPAGFRDVWTRYYTAMEALAAEVMRLFALALDLDEDYFDNKIDKHISNLFANHCPEVTEEPEPGQLRSGEHTDYGSLTLLHQQDDVGGLEVFVDGVWHPVDPVPGAFVVNIGDLMARWTNDRWISTLHRVRNGDGARRISLPFFCQPNYDTVIECLPTCTEGDAAYAPITSGANMTEKTRSSFAL
jgi:isopenicillin N synthase-like dioxygenase